MPKARRSLPASYVVRLYRADPVRVDAVAGLVEDLERGITRSFRSGTELLRHLAGERPGAGAGSPPRSSAEVERPTPLFPGPETNEH